MTELSRKLYGIRCQAEGETLLLRAETIYQIAGLVWHGDGADVDLDLVLCWLCGLHSDLECSQLRHGGSHSYFVRRW